MEMPAAARINTTSVNATGHYILAEFDIRRWAFSGGRFTFVPKKVPPPTPDGREGRLFPPEQSSKICGATSRAYTLPQQKFLKMIRSSFRRGQAKALATGISVRVQWHLRKAVMRSLILYAQFASGKAAPTGGIVFGCTSVHARPKLSADRAFYFSARSRRRGNRCDHQSSTRQERGGFGD